MKAAPSDGTRQGEALVADLLPLIRKLRKGIHPERNWPAFQRLVTDNAETVIRHLSLRWQVSICDTYADYGDPVERRNAFLLSLFINSLRVAETYQRLLDPAVDTERLRALKNGQEPLYSGLNTLNIDRQDTCLNLSKRMLRLLQETPLFLELYGEMIRRLREHDTLLSRFAALSARPEWLFPLNALEIEDNHGVR